MPTTERRHTHADAARGGGRRWEDDPYVHAAVDRLRARLSQRLHVLREDAGWSLETTARAAGIDAGTLLGLEQTRTNPRLSTLVRLALVFGFELEVVLRRRSAEPDRSPGQTCTGLAQGGVAVSEKTGPNTANC